MQWQGDQIEQPLPGTGYSSFLICSDHESFRDASCDFVDRFVDPRPKTDPQNHTNGHEQEVKKRFEMRSEK